MDRAAEERLRGERALFVINDYDIHTLLPSFVAPKSFSGVQATT